MTDNVHRLFGVTADITGLDEKREYENAGTDAAYQSWLRQRIAMLGRQGRQQRVHGDLVGGHTFQPC